MHPHVLLVLVCAMIYTTDKTSLLLGDINDIPHDSSWKFTEELPSSQEIAQVATIQMSRFPVHFSLSCPHYVLASHTLILHYHLTTTSFKHFSTPNTQKATPNLHLFHDLLLPVSYVIGKQYFNNQLSSFNQSFHKSLNTYYSFPISLS